MIITDINNLVKLYHYIKKWYFQARKRASKSLKDHTYAPYEAGELHALEVCFMLFFQLFNEDLLGQICTIEAHTEWDKK